VSIALEVDGELALGVAYSNIAQARNPEGDCVLPRVSAKLAVRLTVFAAFFLAGTYAFVRLFVRWE